MIQLVLVITLMRSNSDSFTELHSHFVLAEYSLGKCNVSGFTCKKKQQNIPIETYTQNVH